MTDITAALSELLEAAAAHPVMLAATPGTVLLYLLAVRLHKKLRLGLLNPLLLTMLALIAVILVSGIEYGEYQKGSTPLSFLAETAIVSLALPLYQKWPIIKKYALPVVLGSVISILISFLTAFIVVKCFGLDHRYTATVAQLPPPWYVWRVSPERFWASRFSGCSGFGTGEPWGSPSEPVPMRWVLRKPPGMALPKGRFHRWG